MTTKRTELLLWALMLWMAQGWCGASAWAAPAACRYPALKADKGGSGIGGTGAVAKGSGIGGTGAVANGSGIGGTGARADAGEILWKVAGAVTFSSGTVQAAQNGWTRKLAKGDLVCEGEMLSTGGGSEVRIKMEDGGSISLRKNTQIKLAAFEFGRWSKKSEVVVLVGTTRFVTGRIGKDYPQNVIVRTPSALIGVHGTDHETTVILPGAGDHPAGTYDKVSFGVTFIRTERGEIDVYPEQVGFAPTDKEPPVLLHEVPEFLQVERSAGSVAERQVTVPAEEHVGTHASDAGNESHGVDHHDHPGEDHSIPDGHEHVDIHDIHDLSGHHDLPEPPELPEVAEMPEKPELPEVPETHED